MWFLWEVLHQRCACIIMKNMEIWIDVYDSSKAMLHHGHEQRVRRGANRRWTTWLCMNDEHCLADIRLVIHNNDTAPGGRHCGDRPKKKPFSYVVQNVSHPRLPACSKGEALTVQGHGHILPYHSACVWSCSFYIFIILPSIYRLLSQSLNETLPECRVRLHLTR